MVSQKLPAVVVAGALLAGVLLAPGAAQAQRGGGGAAMGRGGGGGGNGAGMSRGAPNGRPALAQQAPGRQWSGNQWSGNQWSGNQWHNHNNFVGRPFFKPFVRPFFPFAVAPSVVYAAPYYYPPYYDYPPAYYNPPPTYYAPSYYPPAPTTYYSPPPSGTISVAPAPPAAPPSDNVIQYPHGRYELRGDGVSTPYRWVWIPNPPPAPPAEPSSGVPSPGDSSFGAPPVPRSSQLYRWTDTTGVVHWTDRIDMVPEKYRAGARQYPPS